MVLMRNCALGKRMSYFGERERERCKWEGGWGRNTGRKLETSGLSARQNVNARDALVTDLCWGRARECPLVSPISLPTMLHSRLAYSHSIVC